MSTMCRHSPTPSYLLLSASVMVGSLLTLKSTTGKLDRVTFPFENMEDMLSSVNLKIILITLPHISAMLSGTYVTFPVANEK